jgi:hypothetical protein
VHWCGSMLPAGTERRFRAGLPDRFASAGQKGDGRAGQQRPEDDQAALQLGEGASVHSEELLPVTRRNPSAAWTSALARQVAADLAARGWRLEQVMSDNAQEFRSATFQATIATLSAATRPAGRRPVAVWNGSSRPSWTSAGRPRSPAT